MENKYKDPENFDTVFEKIKNSKTLKEINDLIIEIYPDWILHFLDSYSLDYPHLQKNWEIATEKNNIKTAKIIIVEFLIKDEDHKLVNIFSEILTATGFIIRSKDELLYCETCNRAIPCENTFNSIKENNIKINIDTWSNKCSGC